MKKMRKTRISENGCVSLLCANGEDFGTHFFGATHFGVSEVWGCGEVNASIQVWGGGLCGGRGLAVKLSLVGLLGFWQRIFAGVSGSPREL